MNVDKHYINMIEVITNIFTIENGKVKILLLKRMEEPYRGYWMLPSNLLMTNETIEECAAATIDDYFGLKGLFLKQSNIFSQINRLPGDRILADSLICLVDYINFNQNKKDVKELQYFWFDINQIPKMAYDHGKILEDTIDNLRKILLNDYNLMKILYFRDFTLSELQSTYEHLLNKKLDRRNFRKKILNLDILVDTNDQNTNTNGRPAKLYYFKDNVEEGEY